MWERSREAKAAVAEAGGIQEAEAASGKRLGLKGTNRTQEQDTAWGSSWRESKRQLLGWVGAPDLPRIALHPTPPVREERFQGKV